MFRTDDLLLSMLPGPCVLREPVLRELAKQSEAYFLTPFEEERVDPLLAKLKLILQTKNTVFVITGGGRVALDTAVMSTVQAGENVVVMTGGIFGDELAELVTWAGGIVTKFEMKPDEPLDAERLRALVQRVKPVAITMVHNETSTGSVLEVREASAIAHEVGAISIVDAVSTVGGIDCRVDEWDLDIVVTAGQKCLESPVGMGIITVSERAWKKVDSAPQPGRAWTRDLRWWKTRWLPESFGGKNPSRFRDAPLALPSQLINALSAGCDLVLQEGLPARFARHATTGKALEAGLRALGMVPIAGAKASAIVKCVSLPDGVTSAALQETMITRHKIKIAGAFSRPTCARISAMGVTADVGPINATLFAIEESLAHLGYPAAAGAGTSAAEAAFRAALKPG
jgi:aspartate aminotransferase-like enzyme